jgi:hypothetical protein
MKELDNSTELKRIGGQMKRSILYLLVVSVLALIVAKGLNGVPQQEWLIDKDNYGKVVGRIVDEDTWEPVKEAFLLAFLYSDRDDYGFNIEDKLETTDQGTFEIKLHPNVYSIQFCPLAENSKYCIFPYPFNLEEKERVLVKVEKGKITVFQLEAPLGGTIKIYTVNQNNVKVDPSMIFNQKFKIQVDIHNPVYRGVNEGKDNLNDGEFIVNRLYPGTYSLEVSFEGLGYPEVKKENILVEKGKTTEVLVNINLNDNTGIEGILTDVNGVALATAYVGFVHKDIKGSGGFFTAYADKNGYYQLKGMPEGYYYATFFYESEKKLHSVYDEILEIKKNVMLRVDKQYPYTKAELDNK